MTLDEKVYYVFLGTDDNKKPFRDTDHLFAEHNKVCEYLSGKGLKIYLNGSKKIYKWDDVDITVNIRPQKVENGEVLWRDALYVTLEREQEEKRINKELRQMVKMLQKEFPILSKRSDYKGAEKRSYRFLHSLFQSH